MSNVAGMEPFARSKATCGECHHRVGAHNIYEGTPYTFKCNVVMCSCRLDRRVGG